MNKHNIQIGDIYRVILSRYSYQVPLDLIIKVISFHNEGKRYPEDYCYKVKVLMSNEPEEADKLFRVGGEFYLWNSFIDDLLLVSKDKFQKLC